MIIRPYWAHFLIFQFYILFKSVIVIIIYNVLIFFSENASIVSFEKKLNILIFFL